MNKTSFDGILWLRRLYDYELYIPTKLLAGMNDGNA